MMPRFSLAASILLVPFAVGATPHAAERSMPNLVFILADDLGYGDVGCYGQADIRTPNIDRLAAEGTRFTQVYAGSSVCAPCRCVLMTGLHTGHARIRNNAGHRDVVPPAETGQPNRIPLESEDFTVAEMLRSAGYATGIVGKWGMGEPGSTGVPSRQGFDDWLGFLNQDHAVNYYTDHLWHNEEKYPIEANAGGRQGKYVQDLFTEHAVEFIRANHSRPFFLYVAYTIPHADYQVPSLGPYADKPWSDTEKIYAAMISRMDGDVGRLIETLRALKLQDRTIVLFSSDNGAAKSAKDWRFRSWRDLRGEKGTFYEGGIRVPMIVRWPGHVPARVTSDAPWYFADFLPTAAELAGIEPLGKVDGQSVLPTLLGKPQNLKDRFLYWERQGPQAVRWGDWKAIRANPGKPLELYDLAGDPTEQRDVSRQHPDVVQRIETFLASARTPSANYPEEVKKEKKKKINADRGRNKGDDVATRRREAGG